MNGNDRRTDQVPSMANRREIEFAENFSRISDHYCKAQCELIKWTLSVLCVCVLHSNICTVQAGLGLLIPCLLPQVLEWQVFPTTKCGLLFAFFTCL